MIKFTVQADGQSLINGATAGISPVIIDAVILYVGNDADKTLSLVSGSVYKDDSGIGEYCKISVEDLADNSSYTATAIGLKSGSVVVAISEPITIVKALNKGLKLEISCQFTGASKCSFSTIAIALPYSTKFREGVVRMARTSGETEKDFTVYNATDIDSKFSDIATTLSDKLVPWKKEANVSVLGSVVMDTLEIVDDYSNPTATITIDQGTPNSDGTNTLSVNGYIIGTAVETTPHYGSTTIATSAISDTAKLITGTYISNLYSNSIDTATTETDNARKLVTSHAVRAYVEATITSIGSGYVHLAGAETITGVKTFEANIVTSSGATISGSAVQSDYDDGQDPPTVIWNNSSNYSKLPTVEVVSTAIIAGDNAVRSEFSTADNNLQEQIDALNAGQNLVDIVDLIGDLKSHSLIDLKAKNDYKHGSSGAVWAIGDKIQVLHDQTNSAGVIVPSMDGVATVYELVKGTPSGAKDQVSTVDNQYYWRYIGQYGCDSYTKSESDGKYVIKNSLDQTITSSSVNNNAPSSLAVYNALDSLFSGLESIYVKLSSSSTQNIDSALSIYTQNSNNNVLIDGGSITLVAGNSLNSATSAVYLLARGVKIETNSTYNFIHFSDIGTSTFIPDVNGDGVASYRAISGASLQDGRLVTVDYLNGITGNLSDYARLSQSNTFGSNTTNTFGTVSATSYTGTGVYSSYDATSWGTATTQIPTVSSIKSAINDAKTNVLNTISTVNSVGSIGLFIYSEIGNTELDIGSVVNGAYLKPAGISLPMSGQISYKSSSTVLSGAWKLLSLAVRRTATEPCLVMAQKVNDTYPIP